MVTAEARRLQRDNPARVAVMDKRDPKRARWHEIWEHNPRLVPPGYEGECYGPVQWLKNYSGNRPYIDYTGTQPDRYRWRADYRVEPGEIHLTEAERHFGEREARDAVIIEPNVKSLKQVNKDWGWARWVEVTELLPRINWIQLARPGTRMLPRARKLMTSNTRTAAAAVASAHAVVTSEGGLHHCAAAFSIPAVVIFGGFISPAVTGYEGHVNLFIGSDEHPLGCGWRARCKHCTEAMAKITPEQVAQALLRLLK